MKLSLKKCRRVLSMLIIGSMMLGVIPVQAAQETVATDKIVDAVEFIAVDELKEVNIDFDLSDEFAYVDEVLSVFQPNDPDGFCVYPNPQEVAAPYIPDGAWCTEVCIIGYVVNIDYRIGNVRYIASYCNDGTVRMTSSVLADEIAYVYEITSDNPKMVGRTDCEKNTIVWQKEEEAR